MVVKNPSKGYPKRKPRNQRKQKHGGIEKSEEKSAKEKKQVFGACRRKTKNDQLASPYPGRRLLQPPNCRHKGVLALQASRTEGSSRRRAPGSWRNARGISRASWGVAFLGRQKSWSWFSNFHWETLREPSALFWSWWGLGNPPRSPQFQCLSLRTWSSSAAPSRNSSRQLFPILGLFETEAPSQEELLQPRGTARLFIDKVSLWNLVTGCSWVLDSQKRSQWGHGILR